MQDPKNQLAREIFEAPWQVAVALLVQQVVGPDGIPTGECHITCDFPRGEQIPMQLYKQLAGLFVGTLKRMEDAETAKAKKPGIVV